MLKKTIFLDIDGCIFQHYGDLTYQISNPAVLLDGVLNKFREWNESDYTIILVTGRKECSRKITEEQLANYGIFYDKLIMGLPRGERIIINDKKPNSDVKVASAIEIIRNEGLKNINI